MGEIKALYQFTHWRSRYFPVMCVRLSPGYVGRCEPRMPAVIAVPAPDGKTGNHTLDDYSKGLQAYADVTDAAAVRRRNRMVFRLMAKTDFAFWRSQNQAVLTSKVFPCRLRFPAAWIGRGKPHGKERTELWLR